MSRFAFGCAAVLALGTLMIPVPSAVAAAAKPQTPTALAAAQQQGRAIKLTWHTPAHVDKVIVRIAHGMTAPNTQHDGAAVKHGRGQATLTGLMSNRRYAVSVWANEGDAVSTPATTTFTTLAKSAKGHVLAGTITDAAGSPLAGVRVVVENYPLGVYASPSTDAHGHYQLHAPAGQFRITVDPSLATGGTSDATGYRGIYRVVTVRAAHKQFDASLRPGGAMTGLVTDTDGHALAGITVTARNVQPYVGAESTSFFYLDQNPSTTKTDADGSYRLTGLGRDNAVQLCFTDNSSPVTGGTALAYAEHCTGNSYTVAARHTRAVPDTALAAAPGGVVEGTITGFDGKLIRNTDVVLETLDDVYNSSTDAHGHYRITAVPSGFYQFCINEPLSVTTSYAPKCGGVSVSDGADASADLTLGRGATVSGRVLGPTGEPASDVAIMLDPLKRLHAYGVGYALTDDHGDFTARNLPAGTYRSCFTTAAADGPSASGVCPGPFFSVAAGEHRIGVDADLGAAGTISGTVSDDAGHPLANVYVGGEPGGKHPPLASPGFAVTDNHGHYRMPGLEPGKWDVCFDYSAATGGEQHSCKASGVVKLRHTTHLDKQFPSGGSLSVTVRDHDRRPIAGADVAVLGKCTADDFSCERESVFSSTQRVAVRSSWASDGNGAVTFHSLDPGKYAVCVFGYYGTTGAHSPSTGYADRCTGSTRTLTLSNRGHRAVHMSLSVAGTVTGKVTDSAGHPLAGVNVRISGSAADNYYSESDFDFLDGVYGTIEGDQSPRSDAVTSADGTYSVRSVHAGQQSVCFAPGVAGAGANTTGYLKQCIGSQPGATKGATPIDVTSGATSDAGALALADAAAVRGIVTGSGGKPLRHVEVVVIRNNTKTGGYEITHASGRYRIAGLTPGTVRVCAYNRRTDDEKCTSGVTLTSGATSVVNFKFGASEGGAAFATRRSQPAPSSRPYTSGQQRWKSRIRNANKPQRCQIPDRAQLATWLGPRCQ